MRDPLSAPEGKPLSQLERVVDTFVAPSKTFADILRNASWWLPFLITVVLSLLFSYVVLHRVGIPALVDNVIHSSGALEDRIANSSPGDAARMRAGIAMQFNFMYVYPVLALIFGLIVSGVLLGTANFVFGGRARYKQMLAVWFYATLPLAFIGLLTVITIYAGMTSDSFNIKNTVGTNVGYYLQGGATPRWLVTLLSSVDVFAIWTALLLTLGISIIAGIKRSSAAITVFGWWFLYVLFQTVAAAISG
jgi:hypothetical protein